MSTPIEPVPVNPRLLAAHPDFPDLDLYRRLLDRVGKLDADRLWNGARVIAGMAHPSVVSS